MKLWLLITLIILLLILMVIIPFKIKVIVHVDYLNLNLYYLVNFLFINFLCGKASLDESMGARVQNKSNILFKKSDGDDDPNLAVYEYIKRMKVVNINFYKSYGMSSDSMRTALVCAIDKILYDVLGYFLLCKNIVMNTYGYVEPRFTEDENKTSIYAVIKISILDVIISLISAKLRVSKIKRKEKNNG